LYYDDILWSSEGQEFTAFDLPLKPKGTAAEASIVRVGLGICMDINWKDIDTGDMTEKALANF